tara:strand:+ start:252 stop:755 length:504 start_codon:yes stop_codon:yes gene_type:complete
MMKTFVKIILFFLFASSAHAYCDFETMRIGQSIKAIPDKLKSGFLISETIDQPFLLRNRSEEICYDEKFEGILIDYEFLAGELQRIQIDDEIGVADHLSNLKYYYGEPTELSEDKTFTGIRYYYWKLDFKEIFLITRFAENTSSHKIEFLSNQYDQIKNAGKDFLDD